MNHEFCMGCGHKALFPITKPKFCPNCGVPFNVSLSSSTSTSPAKRQLDRQEAEEESDFDVEAIDLDALRKQISYEGQARKTSLDDLWRAPAPSDGTRRVGVSCPQGKDLLRQIERECAPSTIAKEVE